MYLCIFPPNPSASTSHVYLLDDGTGPLAKFLESLPQKERRCIKQTLSLIARSKGTYNNPAKFKCLGHRFNGQLIYEIKCYQLRIGCFWNRNNLYLAHGFLKKQQKWPVKELKTLERACLKFRIPNCD